MIWVLYGIWLVAVLVALVRAPWRGLLVNRLAPVFVGSLAVLVLIWQLRAGAGPAQSLHFLGVTAVTLMFGWCLTLVGASIVSIVFLVAGSESARLLPVTLFASVLVPATLTFVVDRAVARWLPRNPFVYIFLCAFLAGVLSALLNIPLKVVLLSAAGTGLPLDPSTESLAVLPLFAFPEGVLNGMLITVLVVLRPHWLRTYIDPPVHRSP